MSYGEFAKIYDELIYEDIDYDKIKDKINSFITEYNIDKEDYLDLACGTGNVSINIAPEFKTTYLVDLSEEMLDIAFNKFKKNKIRAKMICQEMSELSLNHTFDLITCVLDSTNYILEEEEVLDYFKSVKNHLKDNGIFVFDINSFYKITEVLGNNIYTYSEEKIFYTWENTLDEDNIVNMFLTFFVKQGEYYERFEEEHYERAYSETKIEELLEEAELNVLHKYDGYSDEAVNDKSERILYVVNKKK